jgi:PAS domain S-box-containing protein
MTIDDEQVVRDSIKFYLEDYDFNVLEAENGKIGLEIFRNEHPDLVLVDLRMPEVDGLDVLRAVRETSPDTPIIVVSGTGVISDVIEALRLGAWDYLLKPIEDMSILLYSVNQSLERARLIKENKAYQDYLEEEVALRTREIKIVNQELISLNQRLRHMVESVKILAQCTELYEFSRKFLAEFHDLMGASCSAIYFHEERGYKLFYQYGADSLVDYYSQDVYKKSWYLDLAHNKHPLHYSFEDIHKELGCSRKDIGEGYILVIPILSKAQDIEGFVLMLKDSEFTSMDREISQIFTSYSQEAFRSVHAIEAMHNSEERYRNLSENSPTPIVVHIDGKIVYVNPAAIKLYGAKSPQEIINKEILSFIHPNFREQAEKRIRMVNREKITMGLVSEKIVQLDGTIIDVEVSAVPVDYFDQDAVLALINDITDRLRAERQIREQIDRLNALHTIDMAITASTDLNSTMSVIIDQILLRLNVDAVELLLYEEPTQTLMNVIGKGFHGKELKNVSIPIGASLAGKIALDRKIEFIPDLRVLLDEHLIISEWLGEGFKTYIGIPLIARGQIMGVLELFERKEFHPDPDWLNFLNTIAGQAAIAIDNSVMFDNMRRSNIELTLAYDRTLEGWAKALELRDEETEGHSRRVTDITIRIARKMGIDKDELVHVRRGALLHDIGKMGIPDSILFKPGKLTDEEWEVMHEHPVYAYNLLSPIPFLRPALDIPYCHHERWNGSGYPRRLREYQIPLAARIFAVVDVWDALSSDRPYRSAWPNEKVLAYLKEQAGIQFDPEIVDLFIEIMQNDVL